MRNGFTILLSTFVLVLFIFFLALANGCRKETAVPGAARRVEKPKVVIGYSVPDLANQYWVRVTTSMKEAAKNCGAELVITDSKRDAAKQISDVEDLIQRGIDVLLLSPWDADTCGGILKVTDEAKVPVVVVDVGVSEEGDYACFIISDNKKCGQMAGEYIQKTVGSKGKVNVAWIQIPQATLAGRLRTAGFNEMAQKYGFNVIGRQDGQHSRDVAASVMEDLLQKGKDINAVFCENDEMALGAMRAIMAAGKIDDVTIVGIDGNADAIAAIKDGTMAATVAQNPELMAKIAVAKAYTILAGALARDEKETEYSPIEMVTKETLGGE